MSRLKRNQNIDGLIQGIKTIAENRCSLSDEDVVILNEALNLLDSLKKKKGKTNEDILTIVVKLVGLLSSFFKNDSEVNRDNQ
jgi:cell division protein ZapA (FtsZ GTPase activity inhibitor)